jgi:membrane protease YdiL (CAAX protease family)
VTPVSGSSTGRALDGGAGLPADADRSARGGRRTLPARVSSVSPRLLLSLLVVWALFGRVVATLGSDRGQAGLLVGSLVVAAVLFRKRVGAAARALGLGRPTDAGLLAATVLALMLLLVLAVFAAVTGVRLAMKVGWLRLVPGLLAQAGIAEEALFRGYLFRHLRVWRSFARAAWVAAGPFAAVHLRLLLDDALAGGARGRRAGGRPVFPARVPLRPERPHDLGAGHPALRRAGRHQGRRGAGRDGGGPADHVDGSVRHHPASWRGSGAGGGASRVIAGRLTRGTLTPLRCPSPSVGHAQAR